MSYLADFLFPPRRAQSPVRMLSGGERNRLLLARLFARPANVLVLDEPTNDLDIESLELLEAALQDYAGTLLLVSHDRAFLDNVVTQTIAAEGGGAWKEYVGGYSDWLRQRPLPFRPFKKQNPGRSGKSPKPSFPTRKPANWKRCRRKSRRWRPSSRRSPRRCTRRSTTSSRPTSCAPTSSASREIEALLHEKARALGSARSPMNRPIP